VVHGLESKDGLELLQIKEQVKGEDYGNGSKVKPWHFGIQLSNV